MGVHDLNSGLHIAMLSGLNNLGWRMNVSKTLFAQVMEYVSWKIFGRIVERRNGDIGVRTSSCAPICFAYSPIDVARVLARHRGLADRQSSQAFLHGIEERACPTNALDHQADIVKVQEWLGHANIATTRFMITAWSGRRDSPTFKVSYKTWPEHVLLSMTYNYYPPTTDHTSLFFFATL